LAHGFIQGDMRLIRLNHICSFNAQPEALAFFAIGPEQAGAFGWALNESISTGSGATLP
jgi:hypothetical protein